MTIEVRLTWPDIYLAALAAVLRVCGNLYRGEKDTYGEAPGLGLGYMFVGCIGEIAVAKWKKKFWTGNVDDKTADDAGRYQVRACTRVGGCMIMHHKDADEKVFINALIERERLPFVVLRGWLYGEECKKPEHWRDNVPHPAFFVKPKYLHPMDTLPEL